MKKWFWVLLYVASAFLSGIFALVFSESISFFVAPVIVIAALILQAIILLANDVAETTSLSSGDLNKAEVYSLMHTIAYATLCAIPLLFPLILFGSFKVKTVIYCTIWVLTFLVGFVIFRINNSKKIKNRINLEEKELQEQKKREEEGRI